MTGARKPIVLAANQKGGVGKSSVIANVSVAVARKRRVLVLDCDQQANLTKSDLGVTDTAWDKGASLAGAIQYGSELVPQKGIRPNLDVVCGGPHLTLVTAAAEAASSAGIDLAENLRTSIDKLCRRERYDIVFVDSGPGDVRILQPLLEVCTHLVVPTKEDEGSIDGVKFLAARYRQARRGGSAIQLLGVVLFDVNPRATARNDYVLKMLAELLEGSGADVFGEIIRTDKATALDLRERHMTAQELVTASAADRSSAPTAQRNGRPKDTQRSRWSRDPIPLANDYQKLAREILVRVSKASAVSAGD